tara:strand:+ start:100 stop:288 length:189 start_codon:yes stop_codon:yes gene_type:complete
MRLTFRQRTKIKQINDLMTKLHNHNNAIYEFWMDDEYPELREEIKITILELKKLLHGIQEEI